MRDTTARAIGLLACCLAAVAVLSRDSAPVPEEFVARRFVLVDDNGKQTGLLANTNQGPGFWLHAPDGDITAVTAMADQKVVGWLRHGARISDLSIGYGNDGEASLFCLDEEGRLRVVKLEDVIRLMNTRDSTIKEND